MYDFYLDKICCPVAPEKLQIKINNKNKTLTLINDGEINFLKKAGLSEITFDLLLPNVKYPFAVYKDGFKKADYYLSELEKLKTSQKPFKFKVIRQLPNGKVLFSTNMKVSLEQYSIDESADNGFDVKVNIKLKQYKDFSTKTCKIKTNSGTAKMQQPITVRKVESKSGENKPIGIGSEVIVNGRLHGTSYGEAPGQTRTNYRGKINFINLQGTHPYHVTTPDGGWLGWVTKDSVKAV